MAWGSLGTLGGGGFKASQTTVTLTTSATAEVGNVVLVVIGLDNVSTADATAITSGAGIVQSVVAGTNTFKRLAEATSAQATNAGATTSIWYCQVSSQITSGATIVATFTTTRGAGAITAWEFSKAATTVVARALTGSNVGAASAMLSTSLNVTTPNTEWLRFRAGAGEEELTTTGTKTAAFTALIGVTGTSGTAGTADTNIILRGEYLISTSTGQASLPTGMPTCDWASVYVALEEASSHPNGWDFTQSTKTLKASQPSRVAAVALASSGLIFALPPLEAPPEPEPFAAAHITQASATTGTLFYQALCAPVPLALPEPPPLSWHQALSLPLPKRGFLDRSQLTQPFEVIVPPPVALTADWAVTPVTTGQVSRQTLFYQAQVNPPYAAEAVVVVEPVIFPQLSTAPARSLVQNRPYQPFVPKEAVLENTVTPDAWQPNTNLKPAKYVPPRIAAQPFVPKQFVEDVVGPEKWLQPFGTARARKPIHTQPVSGFPYEAADNTTTTLEWMQAWTGPPRYQPAKILAQPFVPREALVENTTTTLEWMRGFDRAVPVPPVWHTQPLYGYPYEGVDNSRDEWDWSIAWQGPPRLWPLGKPYQPFVPREATVENTITGIAWLQAFQGPPKYTPLKVQALPFVPREALVENTATGIPWMQAWQGSKPTTPVHTQPFYGYPYEAASNLTTTLEWMVAWRGPPAYKPVKTLAQPFVPREATLENTITPDKWMGRFAKAVPAPARRPTQPFYGYPYEAQPNLTTSIEWLTQWKGPPRITWKGKPFQPFVYAPPAVDNTVTPDKWLVRFSKAVDKRKPRPTQPFYGYPYEGPATQIPRFSTYHTSVDFTRTLYVQARFGPVGPLPPLSPGNTVTGIPWMQAWRGPPRYRPVKTLASLWMPREPLVVAAPFAGAPVHTARQFRRTLFYQAEIRPLPVLVTTVPHEQYVMASLTVEFHRMLRYSCREESDSGSVEQTEQSDPWATQDEQSVDFAEVNEQSDPWSTQDEQANSSEEEEPTPESGCT